MRINFGLYSTEAELLGILTNVEEAILDEKVKNYKTLTLVVNSEEPFLSSINESKDIVFIDEDNKFQEFHIIEIDEVDEESHTIQLTCEQSIQEIIDNVVIGLQPKSKLIEDYADYILSGTRFNVGTVESGIYDKTFNEPLELLNSMEALDKLVNHYNCEYEVRYETDNVNKIVERYIDFKVKTGRDLGKVFSVGKDVTSVRRVLDVTGVNTAIYPYVNIQGEDGKTTRLTIREAVWSVSNGDPVNKPFGEEILVNTKISEKYGRYDREGKLHNRVMKAEFNAENVKTAQELIKEAWNVLQMNSTPRVTYELNAVDLFILTGDENYRHENVRLGDICSLVDNNFKPALTVTTRVVERHIDLINPQNSTFVLGESVRSLSNSSSNDGVEDQIRNLENMINITFERLEFLVDGKFVYDDIKQNNTQELVSTDGYIYAKDGEGLWVFDKPTEGAYPTKAVAIKGGCVGFGTRDMQTGEWVFDTFINGNSVNASLINTGKLNGELLKANTIDAKALKQEAIATINNQILQSTEFKVTVDGVISEAKQGMASLEDIKGLASLEDLIGMASLEDLKGLASLEDLIGMASLEDIKGLASLEDIQNLYEGFSNLFEYTDNQNLNIKEGWYWYQSDYGDVNIKEYKESDGIGSDEDAFIKGQNVISLDLVNPQTLLTGRKYTTFSLDNKYIILKPNTDYTLSWYGYSYWTAPITVKIYGGKKDASSYNILAQEVDNAGNTGVFRKHTITFNTGDTIKCFVEFDVQVQATIQGNSAKYMIYELQLKEGKMAGDWSLNLKDVLRRYSKLIVDAQTGMVTESKMDTAIEQAKEDARKGMVSTSTLEQTVDGFYFTNAKMGQYNLLLNSDGSASVESWKTYSSTLSPNFKVLKGTAQWCMSGERTFQLHGGEDATSGTAYFRQEVELSPNTTYTISYWIAHHRCGATVSVNRSSDWWQCGGKSYSNAQQAEGGQNRDNWRFDSFTFKTSDNTTAGTKYLIIFQLDNVISNPYLFVVKPCLVVGNVPKAWTGHPDEVNINITYITESGLRVEHNNSNTYTQLNSEGLNIVDKASGNVNAYFGQGNSAYINTLRSEYIEADNVMPKTKASLGEIFVYMSPDGSGDYSGKDINNKANSFSVAQETMCKKLGIPSGSFRTGFHLAQDTRFWFYVYGGGNGIIEEENVAFKGITASDHGGNGIWFHPSVIFRGEMRLHGIQCRFLIRGDKTNIETNDGAIMEATNGNSSLLIYHCSAVSIHSMRFRSSSTGSGASFQALHGSSVSMSDCDIYQYYAGFVCDETSRVRTWAVCGSGMTFGASIRGGLLIRGGTYPAVSTQFTVGGVYHDSANFPVSTAPSIQVAPPAPTTQTVTTTFAPSNYYSVRPTYTEQGVLNQSDWNGNYGNWVGHITFGSNVQTWLSNCTGYSAQVYLQRQSSSHGIYTNSTVHLQGYGDLGTLSLGEGKWFTIPTSFVDQFKNGSRTELVFDGTGNSSYIKFNTNAQLKITGTKPV